MGITGPIFAFVNTFFIPTHQVRNHLYLMVVEQELPYNINNQLYIV